MSDTNGQANKGGCGRVFASGCLTVVLLLGVGGFLVYRNLDKIISHYAADYVANKPAELPALKATDQEKANLAKRIDAFKRALKEGTSGQELVLTSRDINMLIQKNPNWTEAGAKAYVTLDGDKIRGDVSLPLEKLGAAFKGRWLNGSGTFRVETAAGRLLVFMDTLSVRDKTLPDRVMAGLRNKNLAEEAAKTPENAALLAKLESVTVRDSTLRIKAK